MKSQSHDILARLLATENLSVVRSNVHTASFDIVKRVLTLPIWKDLTQEVEEMLILHEVGHALYTTAKVYCSLLEKKKHLVGYANIIEDVRIEKRMKERYPGSRKSFNIGYNQLNEKDFFGIKDKDLSKLLLIDRINLYYKVGYNAGVPFTDEEMVFVRKTDCCVTEEDVILLAEEIFEYSKQKKQEEQEQEELQNEEYANSKEMHSEGGEPLELSEQQADNNTIGEQPDNQNNDADDQLNPETAKAMDENLSELVDEESAFVYYDAKFEITGDQEIIIGHKRIIKELNESYSEQVAAAMKSASLRFTNSNAGIVNYLVKEFEMRKSASAYKRTKMSRLGQLDTRKLFAYKLKDDLFKQIATVQDGKKHGMIFLLDWSGSMYRCIEETVKQVIVLAMFCRKINIPYQVFAFTDGYRSDTESRTGKQDQYHDNGLDSNYNFKLLELYSDKMNSRDFMRMTEFMLKKPWNYNRYYGLHGTPLNSSLIYIADYIGDFIKQNAVEKMNLIVLTDGESNGLSRYNVSQNTMMRDIQNGKVYARGSYSKKINVTSVLRDTVTHKEYNITNIPSDQTEVLLTLIKDRYNLHIVGFYISENRSTDLSRFVRCNVVSNDKNKDIYGITEQIRTNIRKDKASIHKNVRGRDELYIISSTDKISNDDMNITEDMNSNQLSKELTKMFTSQKNSRVVLNSFIKLVA